MEDRMRQETMTPPAEGESDVKEAAAPPTPESPVPTTAVMAVPKRPGKLTAMLALEEPARTEALEKAATAGLTVNLRSRTGSDVRWRYGEHVLVVPAQPKPFATAHAIHLLFSAPHLVEEVED
jgi:hypothetical protein